MPNSSALFLFMHFHVDAKDKVSTFFIDFYFYIFDTLSHYYQFHKKIHLIQVKWGTNITGQQLQVTSST